MYGMLLELKKTTEQKSYSYLDPAAAMRVPVPCTLSSPFPQREPGLAWQAGGRAVGEAALGRLLGVCVWLSLAGHPARSLRVYERVPR